MSSEMLWLLAATAAVGDAPTDSLRDADAGIEVITVEASKIPTPAADIASRVTVIDERRIERELAQNIGDLVRYEPGVEVADQGSRFGLSGFSIRGIGGNRVQIEVDGVPTSDAFSIGSFSNASRDFVDVANLKQVEIIRGPSSALFGSDALGGVVSFVTKGPADYLRGRDSYYDVSGGFNSVDDSTVAGGTFAWRIGEVGAMLRATRRDGAERDVPGADPLDEDSLNALARFSFGAAGAGGIELSLEHFRAASETEVDSLERTQDFTAAFGFPFVIDTSVVAGDDERERSRVSLGQEWVDGRFGTDYLRWRLYRQDSETRQDTFEARESFIAGRPSAAERQRSFRFEQELTGLEINAANRYSLGGVAQELAYGLEYELTDTAQIRDGTETDLATGETSGQVGPDLFPLRDFPLSETTRTGVYLQNRITLGAVSLVPGLRWDRYELEPEPDAIFLADNPGIQPVSLREDELSPKLGALWDIGERWQLYAQYAEGFRAPPVNDVNVGFTNFQFGYTTIPNPDLKAESSRGYEAGVRHYGETALWELAAFSTRYDDFIESFQVVDFDPINSLIVFQSVNVDEVEIEGVELQGRYAPALLPEGLSLNLSAAWADGEDRTTGAPVNSVSPLNAVLGLEYAEPDGAWGASFIVRGAAAPDELDESAGPLLSPAGYVVYDAFGYWRPSPAVRLRAGIYNLTDHEYLSYLDVQGVPADVADPERFRRPGRHFSVAFDWNF
jgi:hemoglobin/transferrin/lactoferrin receptor protein